VVVPEDFDWGCEYYRVQILDSTDRGNPRAPWAPRWCRFYPVAVGGVGGWAMRFEGEQYALNFVEAIGPHRFRDLLNDGGAIGAGGFRWPASGAGPAQVALREVRTLDEVLRHVPGRRTVIQAGGNVGVYPAYLAEYFSQVITFEPDAANFECLDRNVAAPNVRKHHAALGGVPGTAGLVRAPLNAGAHYMEGAGAVRVVTVDSLGVADCDFMCLDVEGAEFAVLKGAEATIARCRPVIMFEDKGMSERYGIAQGAVERWLAQVFGYRLIGRTPHDALMVSA
jgi:FkbM family methyltransferase